MYTQIHSAPIQVDLLDSLLLTVLQVLVALGLVGASLLGVHLLVRALQADHGRLRDREARYVLAAAGVLFAVGLGRLVVIDGTPSEGLASVALAFATVTYLLYVTRPTVFELPGDDERATEPDTEPGR